VDWETVLRRIEFNKAVCGASKARKEFGMKREVILQVSVNYAEALRTAGRKLKVLGLRTEQRILATSARPSEGATTNSTTQVQVPKLDRIPGRQTDRLVVRTIVVQVLAAAAVTAGIGYLTVSDGSGKCKKFNRYQAQSGSPFEAETHVNNT
jgi:hypothetical protein